MHIFGGNQGVSVYNPTAQPVIIFGIQDTAELAAFYLERAGVRVAGFTVHKEYIKERTFKPRRCLKKEYLVFPFEMLETYIPPSDALLFAPMTGNKMNQQRQEVYEQAKKKGYEFISYVSPHATVLSEDIGENCFILEDNTIQPYVKVGNNVVMWSGNHIGHDSVIEDHSFFTSHVVLSGHCKVGKNCWFGVNATIRNGVRLREGTLVAMSASITKDTDPWSLYMGVPAQRVADKDPRECRL